MAGLCEMLPIRLLLMMSGDAVKLAILAIPKKLHEKAGFVLPVVIAPMVLFCMVAGTELA